MIHKTLEEEQIGQTLEEEETARRDFAAVIVAPVNIVPVISPDAELSTFVLPCLEGWPRFQIASPEYMRDLATAGLQHICDGLIEGLGLWHGYPPLNKMRRP